MSFISARKCFCCAAPYRNDCVIGPSCHCAQFTFCVNCEKCSECCECTVPELKEQAERYRASGANGLAKLVEERIAEMERI